MASTPYPFSGRRLGWAFLALNLPQLSQTLLSFLVAPFINPEDLGVVALGAGVVLFFENLRDAGLQEALMREKNLNPALLNSVGWFLFIGGLLWAFILWKTAPLIADLLKTPPLREILPVLALMIPLEGLNRVPLALLMRRFEYQKLLKVQLFPLIISLPVTLYLARTGWGYWSLIWGGLLAAIVRTLAFSFIWRLGRKEISFSALQKALFFGVHILWQVFLAWGQVNILRLLVGRFLGVNVLGLLSLSISLTLRPLSFLSFPLLKIALPYFARFQDDPAALKRSYWHLFKRAVPAALALAFVLGVGLPPLIPKIFGPQWKEAAPLVRFFALVFALQSPGWLTGELFKALGRPGVISRLMSFQICLNILVYALVIPRGLKAFLIAFFILETSFSLFNFVLAQLVFRDKEIIFLRWR